jgi:hypothetical protein
MKQLKNIIYTLCSQIISQFFRSRNLRRFRRCACRKIERFYRMWYRNLILDRALLYSYMQATPQIWGDLLETERRGKGRYGRVHAGSYISLVLLERGCRVLG